MFQLRLFIPGDIIPDLSTFVNAHDKKFSSSLCQAAGIHSFFGGFLIEGLAIFGDCDHIVRRCAQLHMFIE